MYFFITNKIKDDLKELKVKGGGGGMIPWGGRCLYNRNGRYNAVGEGRIKS